MLADGEIDVAGIVGDDGVGDRNLVAGEIDFELVAEAARNIALEAEAGAAQLAAETVIAHDAAGEAGEAGIGLDAAPRLERPAAGAFDFRRGTEADLDPVIFRNGGDGGGVGLGCGDVGSDAGLGLGNRGLGCAGLVFHLVDSLGEDTHLVEQGFNLGAEHADLVLLRFVLGMGSRGDKRGTGDERRGKKSTQGITPVLTMIC